MKILESHGVITNRAVQWKQLSELIVEYIFDIQQGLNADPFYDDNMPSITLNNITSYYKYKYHQPLPSNLIPYWIEKFEILLQADLRSKGALINSEIKLTDNGKLIFAIAIQERIGKMPDEFYNTLIHEFRHAYTKWLELTKHIKIHTKKELLLYRQIMSILKSYEKNEDTIPNLIQEAGIDYLILKDDTIFNNVNTIAKIIMVSFYLTDTDEMNSFLQEFEASMQKEITNQKEQLNDDILKFKNKNYKNKTILNNISLTPYSNIFYKRYKSYQMWWNSIDKIDEPILEHAFASIKKPIRTYLDLQVGRKLFTYEGDALIIMQQIKNKMIKKLDAEILKMERLFAMAINTQIKAS